MEKRAELLTKLALKDIEAGRVNFTKEDLEDANLTKSAYIQGVLEEVSNNMEKPLKQPEFDKIAGLLDEHLSGVDIILNSHAKFADLVLKSVLNLIK